jgi:hypothetical protein
MAIRHLPIVGRPTSVATPLRLTRTRGNAATIFGLPR